MKEHNIIRICVYNNISVNLNYLLFVFLIIILGRKLIKKIHLINVGGDWWLVDI